MRARALAALVTGAVLLGAPAAHAAGPPIVSETWVEEVKADSVRLRAKINPNGLSTTYRFEITPQATFEAKGFEGATLIPTTGPAPAGSGTSPQLFGQPVGPPLTPLQPATLYRYRVTAKNSAQPGGVIGLEHVFSTQGSELSFRLPDDRGWELVSPVDKGGGAIAPPESLFGGGDLQASPLSGSMSAAVSYGSSTSFGAAQGAPPVSEYLSQRTASGWSTQNVSAPLSSAAYGDEPDGAPYRVFSEDLSTGLLFGGLPCRGGIVGCPAPNPVLAGSGAPPGHMAYYLRSGSSYASLLNTADLSHTAVTPEAFEVSLAGASPDLSHVVLSSCAALTANATEIPDGSGGCLPAAQNLYEASGGSLVAISLLPDENHTTPETGPTKLVAPLGAISADGSRVYFAAEDSLYLRDGSQTKLVSSGVGAQFQTASADGSTALFTEEVSSSKHLFRYLASTQARTDLTPSGGVVGVLGASQDGTVVYYQDAAGIHKWASGTTTLVAAGAEAAKESDYPPATGTSRVTADGSHLAFLSTKELAGFDNANRAELYLYGPPVGGGAAQLLCASCNPTGEKAAGFASTPGTQANGSTLAYRPRVLSADGHRVFFDSTDKLSIADTNSQPDVYQWEAYAEGNCIVKPGCLDPISSGRATEGASFIDASADGTDVYFLTNESLVGADPGSIDLYDARAGGGFAEATKPLPCVADACQPLPSPPEDPDPGTLIKNSGNPAAKYIGETKKKKGHKGKKKGKGHHKKHKRGRDR
ncbi:MAG TPA: hypothetical protein VGH58_01625 [Solirubrobacterales bacterium]|jgi:hypothetical protein